GAMRLNSSMWRISGRCRLNSPSSSGRGDQSRGPPYGATSGIDPRMTEEGELALRNLRREHRRNPNGTTKSSRHRWSSFPTTGFSGRISDARLHLDAAGANCLHELPVVALVLVGIGKGKIRDRLVKGRAPSHVPGQHCGIARARVCARQRPAAYLGIAHQVRGLHDLDHRLDLDVSELPDIEVPGFLAGRPAEEDVTRRLHQALAGYDAVAVVRVHALPCEWLEDGAVRLLELQEEWVLVRGEEESNGARRADAADTDHLGGHVTELKPVEEHAPIVRQRFPIAPQLA